MEVNTEQLRKRYESLENNDELIDLHRNSDLTELASSIFLEVITSRGINTRYLKAL